MKPGACGNDPRAELTDEDRSAVQEYAQYLRETASQRDTPAGRTPFEQWAAARQAEQPSTT